MGGDLASPLSVASAFRRATALVVLDGLIAGQGFSGLSGLWTLFVSLPRACFDKDVERRRLRLRRAAVFLGAVLLIFGWFAMNNVIAARRGNTLVTAVKAFKTEHQRYPDALEKLVPRFVPEVPLAKYILLPSRFSYHRFNDRPLLFYFTVFPFGRVVYDFERASWQYLD